MESQARAAGARFEDRDGWNVAVGYGTPEQESVARTITAGWCDVSHLGKLELQGTAVARARSSSSSEPRLGAREPGGVR